MPYANIVFIKLEKRLLNDYRWYTMSDHAQLLYVKLILLAAETYNKIPKNDDVLIQALRSSLEIGMFKGAMQEIKTNFPKFRCNKHFYYFDEFEHKTNYIPLGKSQGTPKEIQRVCQNKNKNKIRKEEDKKIEKTSFSFEEIYLKYPNKVGKKAAERHFEITVKTEQDWQDIQIALKNYLASERVNKGFIQNASTWFNQWRDWITMPIAGNAAHDQLRKEFGLK